MVTPFSQAQEAVPPTAEQLYQKGLEEYKAQRFDSASALLSQSFDRDPQPQALFAWAQSERFLFHCEKAALLFDRFIAMSQSEQQTAAAVLAKRRCVAPPAVSPVVSLPTVPPPAPARPVWYRDVFGGSLCAVGVVAIASGVSLVVSAHGLAGEAQSANTLGASQSLRLQAEHRWNWGFGTSLLGALLFSGGISRYVWVSHVEQGTLLTTGGTF
jgi:hypothetical protein